MDQVLRHRTALSRVRLSRPLERAVADGLLTSETSVFDYGCGRGDDLRHLTTLGYRAEGWDPAHRPGAERSEATVVNLGYVVNVIESREERAEALRQAWALAQRLLIVSARLTWDRKDLVGRPLGDGVLTRSGTFQKFFDQTELGAWIEQTLGVQGIAAAPGVYYVFRNTTDAQQFLATRVRSYAPRVRVDPHQLFDAHRDVLLPIVDFVSRHARMPRGDELPEQDVQDIESAFGTVNKATALVRRVTDERSWQAAALICQADLIVYIGLSRFGRRPRLSQLPETLARDIKAHFGSYQDACIKADRMLLAAGRPDLVSAVARRAAVGKNTPSAIYVHRTAVSRLPPVLRLYEGCAQVLAGTVEVANIVKLSLADAQVSYLSYPRFDRVAHPELDAAVTVSLKRLSVDYRDYSQAANPPVLHRKEEFVPPDYPNRELWARLTRSEEAKGLFAHPERIGTRLGWEAALTTGKVALRGHRLVTAGA